MVNRLFLLYFPGFFDGDEIVGIYDDVYKLKTAYERVIRNDADEDGFRYYDIYLSNPNTKLTIEEFDRETEKFSEVVPESLWSELDKESEYVKGPFFILVTADEWNHDADEWIGIYSDKKEALAAYDNAVAEWEKEQGRMKYETPQRVAIFEYINKENRFREVSRKELEEVS